MEGNNFSTISTLFMIKGFLNEECFHHRNFYVCESRLPRAVLYYPIIKVDFAAFAASTKFSPRTSV